jgi:hypothetical protein
MSIAPDFTPMVTGIDITSIVLPILGIGLIVLGLLLTTWSVKGLLQLSGYDIDEMVRKHKRHKRYVNRYERESDDSNYSMWKKDHGY